METADSFVKALSAGGPVTGAFLLDRVVDVPADTVMERCFLRTVTPENSEAGLRFQGDAVLDTVVVVYQSRWDWATGIFVGGKGGKVTLTNCAFYNIGKKVPTLRLAGVALEATGSGFYSYQPDINQQTAENIVVPQGALNPVINLLDCDVEGGYYGVAAATSAHVTVKDSRLGLNVRAVSYQPIGEVGKPGSLTVQGNRIWGFQGSGVHMNFRKTKDTAPTPIDIGNNRIGSDRGKGDGCISLFLNQKLSGTIQDNLLWYEEGCAGRGLLTHFGHDVDIKNNGLAGATQFAPILGPRYDKGSVQRYINTLDGDTKAFIQSLMEIA